MQIVAFILKKPTRICKKLPNFGPEFSLVFRLRKKREKFSYYFFPSSEHENFAAGG